MLKKLFCILTAVLVLAQVPVFVLADSYPQIVQDIEITKTMTQEDGSANVTATAVVSTVWGAGEHLTLCLVAYDDSVATAVEKKDFIVDQEQVISVSMSVRPNVTCKAFVWKDAMTPVSETAEIQVWDSFMVNSEQVYDAERDYMVAPEDVFDLTGEKKIFSYWKDRETDSRISVVEIDPDAEVIWNGNRPFWLKDFGMQKEDIVPPRGTVTLSDRNRDGLYDLLEISAYDVALVKSVDLETNTILLKPYRTVLEETEIKLPSDAELYSITLDGWEITIDELRENDVLNIYMKDWLDPDEFSIVVTRDYIDGVVEQVNAKKESFTVNGRELYLTKGMIPYMRLPELGDNARFYLDQDGNVAYIDYDYLIDNSGYFHRAVRGMFDDEYIYLLAEEGEWGVYTASEQIKINGVSKARLDEPYTKSDINAIFRKDVFEESVDPAPANGVFEGAGSEPLTPRLFLEYMIQYAFLPSVSPTGSAEADRLIGCRDIYGEIESITLPEADAPDNTLAFYGKVEDAVWQGNSMYFETADGPVQVQEDAAVFFIGEGDPQESYTVKSVYHLKKDKAYTAYLYTNDAQNIQTILILEEFYWIASSEPLCIFESYTLSKLDGQEVRYVTYWTNGTRAEEPLTVSEPAFEAVQGMDKGDAFVYGLNASGLVNNIEVIFRPGREMIPFYTDFDEYVDISGVGDHFQFAGQDGEQENEVYFGYVGEVNEINGGIQMVLVDESGRLAGPGYQYFVVPDEANIYYYNPSLREERWIQGTSVSTIQPSLYMRDNLGNIDFENTDPKFMRYAFVRVYKGTVTEVIYVRYTN